MRNYTEFIMDNTPPSDWNCSCFGITFVVFIIPACLILLFSKSTSKDDKLLTKFKVGCAESCTTGNVSALLGSMSGSSKWYYLGQTVYNIEEKVSKLKVDRKNAESCNCVNQRVAMEMSEGLYEDDHAINVVTTGYVGPSDESDLPFYWIGLSSPFHHSASKITINTKYITSEMKEQLGLAQSVTDRVLCQKFMAWYAVKMMANCFNQHKNRFIKLFPSDKTAIEHFDKTINTIANSVTGVDSKIVTVDTSSGKKILGDASEDSSE